MANRSHIRAVTSPSEFPDQACPEHGSSQSLGLSERILVFLALATAAVTPFGDLLRVQTSDPDGPSGWGATRLLGVAIIAMGFISGSVFSALTRWPVLVLLVVYAVWALAASAFSVAPAEGYKQGLLFLSYLLCALSIAGARFSDRHRIAVLRTYVFSMVAVCGLSILDYYGILALSKVNSTTAGLDLAGDTVFALHGPFTSRSIFGVHLVPAIGAAIALFLHLLFSEGKGPPRASHFPAVEKGFYFGALMVLGCSAVMCTSRTVYPATIGAVAYLLISWDKLHTFRNICLLVTLAAAFLGLAAYLSPETLNIGKEMLLRFNPEHVRSVEGDMMRMEILKVTLQELVQNPIGVGFTNPYIPSHGFINPHNNFIYLLRGAGWVGFVIPVYIGIHIIRHSNFGGSFIGRVTVSSLVAMLIYGLTHTTLSMLYFWILAGFLPAHLPHPVSYMPRRRHKLPDGTPTRA